MIRSCDSKFDVSQEMNFTLLEKEVAVVSDDRTYFLHAGFLHIPGIISAI